jgi:hypothetical protein
MKNNHLYDTLKKKKIEVTEAVFVRPLDSYETIMGAVNYALTQSEAIDCIIADEMKGMMECEGNMAMSESPVMPMLYPMLIATYPTFCLFEVADDTFRCDYTYDKKTRNVTLGTPVEVVLDVTMSATPEEAE